MVLSMIFNCDKLRAPPPSKHASLEWYRVDRVVKPTKANEPQAITSHVSRYVGPGKKEAVQIEAKM